MATAFPICFQQEHSRLIHFSFAVNIEGEPVVLMPLCCQPNPRRTSSQNSSVPPCARMDHLENHGLLLVVYLQR